MSLIGINNLDHPVVLNGKLKGLSGITRLEMYHTDKGVDLQKDEDIKLKGQSFKTSIPASSIFTITGSALDSRRLSSIAEAARAGRMVYRGYPRAPELR